MVSRFSEDDCAVFARYAGERDSRYPQYRAFVRLVEQMLETRPRGRLPASPRLTRTYLRCPILWRALGKQFLILGAKPRQAPRQFSRASRPR